MIYVSSTCSTKTNIKDAVMELVEHGFTHIELSGGTRYYPNYLDDLIELKARHGLTYRLHNYFPPPEKSFVLNLASNIDGVLEQSREMVRTAIKISSEFEAPQLGLHAGFRISPKVEELGQQIMGKTILPYESTLKKFFDEFNQLAECGRNCGVELLIENNVFSAANFQSFNGKNPFYLTNSREYFEMKKLYSFPLLLDIAHLKVSCRTLNLDFQGELSRLLPETNYIHISDNDGTSDSNNVFSKQSDFFRTLEGHNFNGMTFTIEVYDGLKEVRQCYQTLEGLL